MADFTIINARIVTLAGDKDAPGPRRGDAMNQMGVIDCGYVTIHDGMISAVGAGLPEQDGLEDVFDADGCVLMPAFVDSHTHACWAGSRLDEFEMAQAGRTYLDILKDGGGIMSTVRAVRETSEEDLVSMLMRRLSSMAALGTGAVEVKSGYGLNTENELKMIRAIHAASQESVQLLVGTFLGAHAIDPDVPDFVERTISECLPAVCGEFPGIACDAYCEKGAWSVADTIRLFEAARQQGCPLRVHTDQFNSLGMTQAAIEMGAVSVDHLEAISDADVKRLADSETIGVLLPCSGFSLDDRYAPGRRLLDAGCALAIASNYNPGSAPTPSMAFTISLAVRRMKMTCAEAITAATYNAACVLGIQDSTATIEVGKRADLQLLDTDDERELAYEFANAGPLLVAVSGRIVHARAIATDEEES
ncbi:MAG: imidazolonepropionase [Phycisphaerales bacterium]|nr:imidazolonepropionase [Phycisphaerales bacterium]